jgi:hypothetical protein
MQERINEWLKLTRDPDFNFYQPIPKEAKGGTKDIIDPPPELWRPEDEKKKKGEDKDSGRKKKKGKAGIRMPQPDDDEEAMPLCPNLFGRLVKESCQVYIDTWYDKDDSGNYLQKFVPEILKSTIRPLVFDEVCDCFSHTIYLHNCKFSIQKNWIVQVKNPAQTQKEKPLGTNIKATRSMCCSMYVTFFEYCV